MLPKKEKFTTVDFKLLKTVKSKKLNTLFGFFIVFPQNTIFQNKKSIVLSKKNFKTAVKRNFYKRLFYNTLLTNQKENDNLKNSCFIFYPNKVFTKEDLNLVFTNMIQ